MDYQSVRTNIPGCLPGMFACCHQLQIRDPRTHCFKVTKKVKRQICLRYHCKPNLCPVRRGSLSGVATGGRELPILFELLLPSNYQKMVENRQYPAEVGFTSLSLIFTDHSFRQICFLWNHPVKVGVALERLFDIKQAERMVQT